MTREEMENTLFDNIVEGAKDHETDLALQRDVVLDPNKLLPGVGLRGNELVQLLRGIEDRLKAAGVRATETWHGNSRKDGATVVKIVSA